MKIKIVILIHQIIQEKFTYGEFFTLVRPKKKNSLSQLAARIAFKNPNLPHFFFFLGFWEIFIFFIFFFPTNGKKVKKTAAERPRKKK